MSPQNFEQLVVSSIFDIQMIFDIRGSNGEVSSIFDIRDSNGEVSSIFNIRDSNGEVSSIFEIQLEKLVRYQN